MIFASIDEESSLLLSEAFFFDCDGLASITQTDRFALSYSAGRLTVLQKHGSRNVTDLVDSRFRGNDRLCYVVVFEGLVISFSPEAVSLS